MSFDTIDTVLRRALGVGSGIAFVVGLAAGLVGLLVAGPGGLWSGLVGSALTVVFFGVTALGVRLVGRLGRGDPIVGVAVLTGGWFLKLALFTAAMIVLRVQPWIVPGVLLASIVGCVVTSLAVDVVVVGRARIPVTDRV